MAMGKCKECGKEISLSAETCPHCGVQLKESASQTMLGMVKLVVILFGVFALMRACGLRD